MKTNSASPCRRTAPRHVISLGLPLINPESLFAYKGWVSLLEFVCKFYKRTLGSDSPIKITLTDLYLMKVYNETFNFRKAKKKVSALSKATLGMIERDDRTDEANL